MCRTTSPASRVDTTPIAVVQPTFLYELLWNLAVAALVVWADRRFRLSHGRAFALYVAGYTAGRFVIELLRTDPATRVFGDVRINVVVSAVVFVGAVIYMIVNRGRPREVFGRDAAGSGDGDPGTPASVASTNSTGDPDEDQRADNEVAARSKEKSSAAEAGGKGGASNASSVDAAPADPEQEREQDAPAEPPSRATS